MCCGLLSHELVLLDLNSKLQIFDKTETNLRTGIDTFLRY
jgi:hypothetical protein